MDINLLKKNILITVAYLIALCCFVCAKPSSSSQKDVFSILKLKGYHLVKPLKTKTGDLLGYIYVKPNVQFGNQNVLSALLVVKANGVKLDTLYQVLPNGDFINSNGKVELRNRMKSYYGFKLYTEKNNVTDQFTIGNVDSSGRLFSDDNDYLIEWEYDTKRFSYYPAP